LEIPLERAAWATEKAPGNSQIVAWRDYKRRIREEEARSREV